MLVAAASVALFALAWAFALRVWAPFPLEWQEPAMMEHALRLWAGEGLYVRPSIDFAPFPYPPLFYGVGGVMMGVLGESLAALRSVSVLGVLLVLGALLASLRGAKSSIAGLAACGWFAATYGWTGFWLDVARVDSLALGFGAVGFALVLRAEARCAADGPGTRAAALAFGGGVASALAVLTKQTQLGLAVALAMALFARARTRRAGAAYFAALLGCLLPSVLFLEARSDGLFLWTTVDLLRGSPFHGPAILGYWTESVWVMGLPLALGVCALVSPAGRPWSPCLWGGALALLVTGWLGRAHEGGFDNTLLPTALGSAFAVGAALRVILSSDDRRVAPMAAVGVVAAMAMVIQDPRPAIPTAAERSAHAAAAAQVAQLQKQGEVWQPISAMPATARGYAHKMAIVDLAKSQEVEAAQRFLSDFTSALTAKRFAAIILDGPPRQLWGDLGSLIEANYEPAGSLPAEGPGGAVSELKPRTGAGVVPRLVLLPR